jgi:hypothetical protein
VLLLLAFASTGCVSPLMRELAADNATFCATPKVTLYGSMIVCRTNAKGTAIIDVTQERMQIIHQGGQDAREGLQAAPGSTISPKGGSAYVPGPWSPPIDSWSLPVSTLEDVQVPGRPPAKR